MKTRKTMTNRRWPLALSLSPSRPVPCLATRSRREMVLTRGDELANSFGFQDDNVRNQVEHLMTLLANHRRYANSMPSLTLE